MTALVLILGTVDVVIGVLVASGVLRAPNRTTATEMRTGRWLILIGLATLATGVAGALTGTIA